MDTNYLMDVFRGSHKKLDQETIKLSRSRFYVGVTCATTGSGEFVDAKSVQPDIVEAIHASLVAPGISRGVVAVGERRWTDGAVSLTFPVQKVIGDFRPTDILILANQDGTRKTHPILESAFIPLLFSGFPSQVRQVFRQRNAQYAHELSVLRAQRNVHTAIVWTDKRIGRFERNSHKLKLAARTAETHLTRLLVEANKGATAPR